MKVILRKDVAKLGKKDDVKNVSDGYAKNFLLPGGLAVVADAGESNALESRKLQAAGKSQKEAELAKELAKKIGALKLSVKAKAGENEELFGSVDAGRIAAALKEKGIEIGKKQVILEEPIKKLGDYKVKIDLGHEVVAEANLKVSVEK